MGLGDNRKGNSVRYRLFCYTRLFRKVKGKKSQVLFVLNAVRIDTSEPELPFAGAQARTRRLNKYIHIDLREWLQELAAEVPLAVFPVMHVEHADHQGTHHAAGAL